MSKAMGWVVVAGMCLLASGWLRAGDAGPKAAELAGRVTAVTVFTVGKARVTRDAKVVLAAGKTVLRSRPLPVEADGTSVQVDLSGLPGVKLQAVEVRSERATAANMEAKQKAHRKLVQAQEDLLFAVGLELRGLAESTASHNETIAFLQQLRQSSAKLAAKEKAEHKLNPEAWKATLLMAQEQSEAARKAIRDLSARTRTLQATLNEERHKLHELRRKVPVDDWQMRAYLTFDADTKAAGTIRLSYTVDGATWLPSYRAQADLTSRSLDLDVFGSVTQSTGEDWKDIILSVSTARPDLGTDVPRLTPWHLRVSEVRRRAWAEEELRRAPAQAGLVGGRLSVRSAPLPSAPEPPAPEDESIASSGVATVFTAEAKADIPSDDQPHRIPVATVTSVIDVAHIAIPKVQPHAFMQATLKNRADFPLLPGVVDVFVAGSFIGRGAVPLTAPGQALKLGLGVDESVRVSLRLQADKVERRRRGDRVQTTNAFVIDVANYGDETINLTVNDQLPISKHPNVKVTYGRAASRALRGAKFPGQLKWAMALKPQELEAIEFDFVIDYPAHMRQVLETSNKARAQRTVRGQAAAVQQLRPAQERVLNDSYNVQNNQQLSW